MEKECRPECSENNRIRRLGIFVFYDSEGIVDDYVLYLLDDIMENLEDLVIVCNGILNAESRRKLYRYTKNLVVRENKGLDAGAWQYAMTEYLGWDRVDEYDEIVLFNDTFFGPFYPFREVFEEMGKRDIDFWGLTCHFEIEDPYGTSPYGYFPTHIQSYFTVIRKKMHCDYVFKKYWDDLSDLENFEEAVGKNEVVFTKYFSDQGFSWDVLVDATSRCFEEREKNYNIELFDPFWSVSKNKCPVLKKKNFAVSLTHYLSINMGNSLYQCVEYLRDFTKYDTDMIWKYILRKFSIRKIFNSLGLQHVLPTTHAQRKDGSLEKVLVILHIYYMDQMDYIRDYLSKIPEGIDILITTTNASRKERLEREFKEFSCLEIIQVENRGRDLSALLVGAKEKISSYEYICFCHDKLSSQVNVSTGMDFQDLLWRNMLGSREYIYNVLNLFETNPRLGLAVPPSPAHGQYTWVLGNGWTGNFANVSDLARRLSLTVPLQEEDFPIASGSAFWCRKKALELLWNYPWKYDDFPEEPMAPDHEISHAIERIFPFVAQQAGYYSAWIMTPRDAMLESRNMRYIVDTMLYHLRFDLERFPGLILSGVEDITGLTERIFSRFFTGEMCMKYYVGSLNASYHHVPNEIECHVDELCMYGNGQSIYLRGWGRCLSEYLNYGKQFLIVKCDENEYVTFEMNPRRRTDLSEHFSDRMMMFHGFESIVGNEWIKDANKITFYLGYKIKDDIYMKELLKTTYKDLSKEEK